MDKHDDCGWFLSLYTIATLFLVAAKLSGSIDWGWIACTSPAWGAIGVNQVVQLAGHRGWLKRFPSPIPSEHNL